MEITTDAPRSRRSLWKVIARLMKYATDYKFRIAGAILILTLAVALDMVGPFLGKIIIDDYIAYYTEPDFSFTPVIYLALLYIGILAASGVLHFTQSMLLQTTAVSIIKKMRMDLYRHVQRLPMRFFDHTPAGRIVNRISNDTESIRELYMSFMATFVVSFIQVVCIYVFMFILDARLASYCLLLLPVFVAIITVLMTVGRKFWMAMRQRISDMNTMLNESILTMPVLQLFRREEATLREFEEKNADWQRNYRKQVLLNSTISRNLIGLTGSLVTAGFVWYFGGQSLQNAVEFGVVYAFVTYTSRFFEPVIAIYDQIMHVQRAQVAAERVFDLLDEPIPEESTDPKKATDVATPHSAKSETAMTTKTEASFPASEEKGHVRFEDVWFAYKADDYVLKGISFEARQGQTIALVGHTGSGKSSIMNLLLGFYTPQRGNIYVDGKRLQDVPGQIWRKEMAVVLQDPFLFTGDIGFNVSLYHEQIGEEEIRAALKKVGADTFVDRLPKGIHEPVIERGSTLSAGQRQLITLARALAFNPSILILDEATSSVDSEMEGLIQQALQVVSKGRTTFVIAHRLSTIRDADLILVLHKGEIVERGTHESLMAEKGRYYRMYELQKGRIPIS